MSQQTHSHKRKNMLTGDWVLVSPHRALRPWKGQVDDIEGDDSPKYDPTCYLCPGNERVNGEVNPEYKGSYVFDNDFSALSSTSEIEASGSPLLVAQAESGCCRVICFSERHDLRLATMDDEQVTQALQVLFSEFAVLDRMPEIKYVQIFENRGQMMGCSNPHPHAQIWATSSMPVEPTKELVSQRNWYRSRNRPLLLDYLDIELSSGDRVVCESGHAVSVVPFWAVWPFETLLLPRRATQGPNEMTESEVYSLAKVLRRTLVAYEKLFSAAVPYSMGFHPRPSDGENHPEWQFHIHIYPPLLRSASVRKHMVGFEMLGTPQRDLTPEAAAERLRAALTGSDKI